jgi:DNA replicative helicase MCM subunit Mcm2 (Cdc46/Mcm family)
MCINNHQSIEIDYNHLKHDTIKLAEWIVRYPQEVLPEYSAALFSAAIKLYPSYEELFKECFFKIGNLPIIDNIRTLSYKHLGGLIKGISR